MELDCILATETIFIFLICIVVIIILILIIFKLQSNIMNIAQKSFEQWKTTKLKDESEFIANDKIDKYRIQLDLEFDEKKKKIENDNIGWKQKELQTLANEKAIIMSTELNNQFKAKQIEEVRIWQKNELEKTSNEKAKELFLIWKHNEEKLIRKDAIFKSKSVIVGKITEQLIPYFPVFKYNPKETKFIGSPIDLIVFNGLDDGNLREIIFIEIKAGETPSMTTRERQVRDCIKNNRVRWEIITKNEIESEIESKIDVSSLKNLDQESDELVRMKEDELFNQLLNQNETKNKIINSTTKAITGQKSPPQGVARPKENLIDIQKIPSNNPRYNIPNNTPIFCPRCDQKYLDNDGYCSLCGFRQPK